MPLIFVAVVAFVVGSHTDGPVITQADIDAAIDSIEQVIND